MKSKIGYSLIAVGIVLVICACMLVLSNQRENEMAQKQSEEVLEQVIAAIKAEPETVVDSAAAETGTDTDAGAEAGQDEGPVISRVEVRQTVRVDGNDYMGYLTIPDLGKILPIMADWSYAKLRIAPCRYVGGVQTDDLVICAHNYASHFGDIGKLTPGAIVSFTDVNGIVTDCEVVLVTVLTPDAKEEMTSGEYPLTLFTCTYGGEKRVTVRCRKANS